MAYNLCLGWVFVLVCCRYVNSQACTGQTTGLWLGNWRPDVDDGTHTLELNSNYEVPCCGVITAWRAMIERPDAAATYNLQFQVFRDTASFDTYTFVGGNSFTVSADGDTNFPVGSADYIAVQANDRIGWTAPVIAYKGNGNEQDDVYKYADPGALTAGNTISIAGVTETEDHSYGLEFTTIAGASPTVTGGTVTVYNNQSSGVIFTVTWGDTDVGDTVTIAETTGDSQFSFDSTTGDVTLVGVSQVNGTVTMTYTATDSCGQTGTGNLVVTIENPAPWFTGPFTATVQESTIGVVTLFTLNVTDPGDPNLSCSMEPALTQFSLQPNGSDLTIVTTANPGFNYTAQNTHTVTIVCYDDSTYVSQDYVVYIVPNMPPVIQNLQNSTLINSTHGPSEVIFQVIATDAENDNLAFNLYCEDFVNPCIFTIADDGNVYLNNVSLVNTSTAAYNVFVNVTDAYGASQTWTLTINVADLNSPVAIQGLPLTVSVNENNAVNDGIFDVTYTDIDTAQSHTWTFTSNPASSYFDVLDNGTVTLLQSIDYESLPTTTYELAITVSDPLTSSSGTLTVVFQNVNEQPEFAQPLYGLSAVEAVAGTSLGTPLWGITDPDAGDTYTLRMGCATYAEYFAMDSSTGEVTLQLEYDIDAGLPTTITCPVNVTDAGGLYSTTNLTMTFTDINDNTPQCSAPAFFFYPSWYTSAGTVLGTVTATDGDTGLFGVLTYSIDQTSLGVQQFAIDANGLITFLIAPSSGSSGLNYTQRYDIIVYATDTGGLQATCSVAVVVGDTTTASAITTTWDYKTFFEFGSNIAWFVPLMLLLAGILGFLGWLYCTCKGALGCKAFLRRLRIQCRGGPRQYDKPMHRHPNMKGYGGRGSVRNPPPAAHSWAQQHKMKVAFIKVPKGTGMLNAMP